MQPSEISSAGNWALIFYIKPIATSRTLSLSAKLENDSQAFEMAPPVPRRVSRPSSRPRILI